MEPGTLTKVLHDFLTTVDGELSLLKGDYFLVHNVIDKHWLYGQSSDHWGKFPVNHLLRADVPNIQPNETLFVGIAHFSAADSDQLSFSKGDLIVGINKVSEDWYYGNTDCRTGIFPVSHTWKLDSSILKTSSKKLVRKKARVKMTLKAQLDEELDLTEGETVTVLEILEDGWCQGVTEDGRVGTFPEAFISYLEEDPTSDETDTASATTSSPNFGDFPDSVLQGAPIYKDFGECIQKDENSIREIFERSCSIGSEPAPDYYDLYPHLRQSSSEHYEVPDPLGGKPYAITLYQFNAQFPNELSFKAGEVVHLIKYIDREWLEGSIDDNKGIFPASYVKVIVDCTDEKSPEEEQEVDDSWKQKTVLEPGTKVKVEYTYQAQMDGDLSVTEGDVVTVVEMANENWVTVTNDKGDVGFCPRTYVSTELDSSEETFHDALEDFVVLRNDTKNEDVKDRAIKRLSEPHRPAPPAPTPDRIPLQEAGQVVDAKQKKANQRQNVISELVLTEKDYVKDLKLTYETFNLHDPRILESQGIDVITLFGNLEEVMHVAEDLLDKILRAMKGCDEEYQTIGPCFLKSSEKMLYIYRKYCGNHEASLDLLKKYENKKEIMAVLDAGTMILRRKIACFDMSSILIKPVQRILKYPLMLLELIKCTEDGHPDKPELEEAWKVMTDVATNINEYKRRKDTISKILDSDNTLMRKWAKLNMHSVAKKSTRLSAKLSATLGFMSLTTDIEFEEYERQFKALQKCAKDLAKDAHQCVSHLMEKAKCGEELAEFVKNFYDGTPNNEVTSLKEIRQIIQTRHVPQLKERVKELVSQPIDLLITALEGPNKLIDKRHDKLIDYASLLSKSEKYKDNRTIQEELIISKKNFDALNQQLLEELPILIDASMKILCECLKAFTSLRKLLSGKVLRHYLEVVEKAQITPQYISKSFSIDYNLSYNKETSVSSENIQQSEEVQNSLKMKYPDNKLFTVMQTYTVTVPIKRTVLEGTLVGIIKQHDPMGDETNWLVDNGQDLALLFPKQYLQPLQKVENSGDANANRNENSDQFYYAMHDFHYNMPGTLSVNEGQALKLIRPHDLKGNNEWWLVQTRDGETGYVPRTYLQSCS